MIIISVYLAIGMIIAIAFAKFGVIDPDQEGARELERSPIIQRMFLLIVALLWLPLVVFGGIKAKIKIKREGDDAN
ncbi:hypothetical protein [Paenibacillus xylanilyticus]|uniref:hypothetical protein n=1 Tax=Paenibacillus xylanilyticus TaxID=248903 RepID=UPI003AAFC292